LVISQSGDHEDHDDEARRGPPDEEKTR